MLIVFFLYTYYSDRSRIYCLTTTYVTGTRCRSLAVENRLIALTFQWSAIFRTLLTTQLIVQLMSLKISTCLAFKRTRLKTIRTRMKYRNQRRARRSRHRRNQGRSNCFAPLSLFIFNIHSKNDSIISTYYHNLKAQMMYVCWVCCYFNELLYVLPNDRGGTNYKKIE